MNRIRPNNYNFTLISHLSVLHQAGLDSLNYFPHTVGNVWQYMYDDGRFFQEKIFQDSS